MELPTGQVINADCLEVLRGLPDQSVDLLLTDPPYGVSYVTSWRSHSDPLVAPIKNDSGDWRPFAREWIAECARVLKNDRHVYCFGSFQTECDKRAMLSDHFNFKNILVWDKMNSSVGDLEGDYGRQYELIYFCHKGRRVLNGQKRYGNILRASRGSGAEYEHPTQKPVSIMAKLIECSTNPGDVVLDPFCGVGSSLVAAEQLGRRWIGVEIEKKYADLARERVKAESDQGKLF